MIADIPVSELTLMLTFFGNYIAVVVYKAVFPGKPINPQWVSGLVAAVVGGGVTLLADGASLERVLAGAIAAGIGFVGGKALHWGEHKWGGPEADDEKEAG